IDGQSQHRPQTGKQNLDITRPLLKRMHTVQTNHSSLIIVTRGPIHRHTSRSFPTTGNGPTFARFDTEIFNACKPTASKSLPGSLSIRCTCSGVTTYPKTSNFMAMTHPRQRFFKKISRLHALQIRAPVKTTERNKLKFPLLLSPFQSLNHPGILQLT